jgi:hypothetical protein
MFLLAVDHPNWSVLENSLTENNFRPLNKVHSKFTSFTKAGQPCRSSLIRFPSPDAEVV